MCLEGFGFSFIVLEIVHENHPKFEATLRCKHTAYNDFFVLKYTRCAQNYKNAKKED